MADTVRSGPSGVDVLSVGKFKLVVAVGRDRIGDLIDASASALLQHLSEVAGSMGQLFRK